MLAKNIVGSVLIAAVFNLTACATASSPPTPAGHALTGLCRDLAPVGQAAYESWKRGEAARPAAEAAYAAVANGKAYGDADAKLVKTAVAAIYAKVYEAPPAFQGPPFVNDVVATHCVAYSNGAISKEEAAAQLAAAGHPVSMFYAMPPSPPPPPGQGLTPLGRAPTPRQ